MNTSVMIIMLAALGLTTAVTAAIPEMSRPTVPLGVSVPSDRVGDPAVRGAIRRYRVWILVGGVVAGVVMVAASSMPEVSVVVLLGYSGWTVVAFAACRRPIMAAKARHGWYDTVPVRVPASATPEQPIKPVWPLLVLAVGISLATVAVVAINYPSLPDPIPTRYDDAGNVTDWASKNWGSVLFLPLVSLGSTVLLVVVCVVLSRRERTRFPDGQPQAAREFQGGREKTLQRALAALTLVSPVFLGILSVAPVVQLVPSGITWIAWGLVTASSLPIVWLVIKSIRLSRAPTAAPGGSGRQSPDDDHLWRWGMFYENREDPRIWVEKRNGLGLTVNVGRPGGIAIMGGLTLLTLMTIVLVLTL
ncbi:DUF1648 domain-containing protein [Corynebacterium timonense]|uniref:Uncharacterized membrane protein n=1 Tax=Corynebacterium timonense TaxID=441500 RepID=A0A1H1MYV0_9CORY|nr:DUF1648 domain-containing protein [Corynebacterium timonense]SDR92071.1 Uncharacterized membrane protein [Corynebacterium timonense]